MAPFKQRIIARKLKEELSVIDGLVIVDENSCDGCGDCINTCPHDAISMNELSDKEVKNLSLKGRLKVRIKGKNKAVIDHDVCTACGLCMKKCHEFAIHKVKK